MQIPKQIIERIIREINETILRCITDILCNVEYDATTQLTEIKRVMNDWAIFKKEFIK